MERWVWLAVLSMLFAGCTSILAKQGLTGISGELGLTIRTGFVTLFVLGFAALTVRHQELAQLTTAHWFWLGLSGATTAVSWVCYYLALKDGEVSTIALIDKGSFVVAVLLAWLVLGEPLTFRVLLGGSFIVLGLVIVAGR